MTQIKLEILEANYWEHFKMAKDIALYLPLNHPKRVKIENEIKKILNTINSLKKINIR